MDILKLKLGYAALGGALVAALAAGVMWCGG